MTTARLVPIAARDAELGRLLDALIEGLHGRGELPKAGVFAPLVALGATLGFGADELEESPGLAPFARPKAADETPAERPAEVTVHEVGAVPPEAKHEYAYETIRPGADWLPEHRAKFWRVVAKAYDGRHSDALLNLRADALAAATPWHLEHQPAEALRMLGERARVMLYASYGEDRVMPVIDEALALWPKATLARDEERHVILQLLEALDRIRLAHDHSWPKTAEVLELAARGLELDGGRAFPQSARLLHSLADGFTHGFRGPPSPRVAAVTERWGGAGTGPLAWAAAAWEAALALEDGDFYGEVTVGRADERKYVYRRGLATLDLRAGRVGTALATLAIPPDGQPYARRRHARAVLRILEREGASREARIEFLTGALQRDVLEAELADEYDANGAAGELAFFSRQLASLGAGGEAVALLERARARPGIAEAAARRAEQKKADEAASEAWAKSLTEKMFASKKKGPGPEGTPEAREAARLRRWNEHLAKVTPKERAGLVVDDLKSRLCAGYELIFDVRDLVADDGRHV
ncbi:MAG TPA: hypothetical protein VFS00_14275, partial [Polyangiaceae bacterium]|nr:hypothetical protein [Polyangiaceae bacterium]